MYIVTLRRCHENEDERYRLTVRRVEVEPLIELDHCPDGLGSILEPTMGNGDAVAEARATEALTGHEVIEQ